MKNFLNLPIEQVSESWDLEGGGTFPAEGCYLVECQHGRVFVKGQPFVRFERSFVHIECLDGLVKTLGRDDFLMLLASHVSIAPSRHNAGTIRQVITNLRTRLGQMQHEIEQAKADAYARGARETAEAIAEAGGSVGLPIDVESAIASGEDEGE